MRECECWEPDIHCDGNGCRCSICDLPPREDDPDILRERIAALEKRIDELEAEAMINNRALEMCSNECNRLYEDYSKQGDALAAQKADASAGLIEAAEWLSIAASRFEEAADAMRSEYKTYARQMDRWAGDTRERARLFRILSRAADRSVHGELIPDCPTEGVAARQGNGG